MRLHSGKLKRRIDVDVASWEYVVVSGKTSATVSITASIVGKGSFNLYIVGLKSVTEAPVKGRISGFNRSEALWCQEEIRSLATKYKAAESGALYIFFDNHHDELEPKSIDVDIHIDY